MFDREKMFDFVINSSPYSFMFVDCDHVVQYNNNKAVEKYGDLVGKCILDCHQIAMTNEKVKEMVRGFQNGGGEVFLTVYEDERFYGTPVRDDQGELLGYYVRREKNLEIKPA